MARTSATTKRPAAIAPNGTGAANRAHGHPPRSQQPIEPDLHAFELDGVDPVTNGVFQALIRVVRLHHLHLLRAMTDEGAQPAQAICLRMVSARDGLSQRELATMLRLSPPTVTTMLQRMERKGLIERRPDATDQRITRVHLTDAGRTTERSARAALAGHVRAWMDPMPEAERRELARLLGRLADRLEDSAAATSQAGA